MTTTAPPIDQPFLGTPIRVRSFHDLTLVENLYSARTHLPTHVHETGFFSLTLAGDYAETHGRRNFDYGLSSVSFHPPHEEHSVTTGPAGTRCFNVEVGAQWLGRLREVSLAEPQLVREEGGPLLWLATRLHEEVRSWSPTSALAVEGLILEMLAVVGKIREASGERNQPRWVDRLEELMRGEFTDSVTVLELAQRIGIHPVHLSRTWRRFRGCSIGQFIHRIRIDAACRRLASPNAVSLADLALEVGYSDQTHFSRVFKQLTGTTPGAYRASFA